MSGADFAANIDQSWCVPAAMEPASSILSADSIRACAGLENGKLPKRTGRILRAAEEMAEQAYYRGREIAGLQTGADAARDRLSALLAENANLFSSQPDLGSRVAAHVAQAYEQGRLAGMQLVLLELGHERGLILGRRTLDYQALARLDERAETYCASQGDLFARYDTLTPKVKELKSFAERHGVRECLNAERRASQLWNDLMGSWGSKLVLRRIGRLLVRSNNALVELADLSPRSLLLVKEVFVERYGQSLEQTCCNVMRQSAMAYAQDLLANDRVKAASSGLSYLFQQKKKFREGTKILQEMRRLLGPLKPEEVRAVRRDFKERFAGLFKASNLETAARTRLKFKHHHFAEALLESDDDKANAILLHGLLTGPKKERKEACDFLEELDPQLRAGLAKAFQREFKQEPAAFAAFWLEHNRGLHDLLKALLGEDQDSAELARLYCGLRGDPEEWPGTIFLGKTAEEGAGIIKRFNVQYGEGSFEELLSKYKHADVSLVKALIRDRFAPSAEIYYASVVGFGCDIETLRTLVRNSTRQQIVRDSDEFKKLWLARSNRLMRFLDPAVEKLQTWFESKPRLGHSRFLGAMFGNLEDTLWWETHGDDLVDLQLMWGGKTEDPHRLCFRAQRAARHELSLPLIRLSEWLLKRVGRDVNIERLSKEASALESDSGLLSKHYQERVLDRQASPDELVHIRALARRVHNDCYAFRDRKRFVAHIMAALTAGSVDAVVVGFTLLDFKWPLWKVMLATGLVDFPVRFAVKSAVKGPASYTWEEMLTDMAHSSINAGTLFLRKAPKAVGVLRRIFEDPVYARSANFAGKIGGKWKLSNIIKYLITRRTANHELTPDEIRRGCFESDWPPELGEVGREKAGIPLECAGGDRDFGLFLKSLHLAFRENHNGREQ
jgi:hypothetical protein